MIGSELYTVTRPNTYLYSGVGGSNKNFTVQPPSGGCYLRVEGVGTVGNVTPTGTATDSSTTETILSTSFDSDKVGFSVKKWTALTKFTSTNFTSLTIYPASESGEKIGLSSSTTFNIICDSYDTSLNQFRGEYIDFAGKKYKIYKTLMYDGRFILQENDKIVIDGKNYVVFLVEAQHGAYSALLTLAR